MESLLKSQWRIISLFSIILLGFSTLFSWQNRKLLIEEQTKLAKERQIVTARKDQSAKVSNKIVELRKTNAELVDEIESLQTELVSAQHETVLAQSGLKKVNEKAAITKKELERKETFDFAEAKMLLADIESLQEKVESERIEMVQLEGVKARIESETERLAVAGENLLLLRSNQEKGLISNSFKAPVVAVYPKLAFTVIGAGNNDGVVKHAKLQVRRGRSIVAHLMVTEVDRHMSIADIIPGSGGTIRIGDEVVAAN